MSLTVKAHDFVHMVDIDRAETIVGSLTNNDLDGKLGKPFTLREEWPDLNAIGGKDCNGRGVCRGCDRLTVSASGIVYTIITQDGQKALGAVCTTSDKEQPFAPVFFTKPVQKP